LAIQATENPMRRFVCASCGVVLLKILLVTCVLASDSAGHQKWVASWAASQQGPYPSGFSIAQPDLSLVFPSPGDGANDQTFRMIVKPDLWGKQIRLQFSNVFGTKAVTFDHIFVGMQSSGANVAPGTNHQVTFGNGQTSVTLTPGKQIYSDSVVLKFVKNAGNAELDGRKLSVSFHIAGPSGPMTWHAKALTTSYVTLPGHGIHSQEESDQSFPLITTSWFFLSGLEVLAPANTFVVAACCDSITDGTGSTVNGDDRWPDFLSRRLHAIYGTHVAVVNTGIGGNQVSGPAEYLLTNPFGGGPSALQRMDRDVLELPGLTTVVWLEGINDLGMSDKDVQQTVVERVIAGFREGVDRLHARGIKVIGATLPPSFKSQTGIYGSTEVDTARRNINTFIKTSGTFDSVVDFDAVTLDSTTGTLRVEFSPSSTIGGRGDLIHPNRAGYQAMANAVDVRALAPATKVRQKTGTGKAKLPARSTSD
jgi:lysophospholipase L1-like esterase